LIRGENSVSTAYGLPATASPLRATSHEGRATASGTENAKEDPPPHHSIVPVFQSSVPAARRPHAGPDPGRRPQNGSHRLSTRLRPYDPPGATNRLEFCRMVHELPG